LFASTRHEAAEAGFDDELIYREIELSPAERKIPFEHRPLAEAVGLFSNWKKKGNKKLY
jgi:guanine deaminase